MAEQIFWETMTIEQMGKLLKEKDDPGWRKLANDLFIYGDKSVKFDPLANEVGSNPLDLAVYFFLCVQESAKRRDVSDPHSFEVNLIQSNEFARLYTDFEKNAGKNNDTAVSYVFNQKYIKNNKVKMTLYSTNTKLGNLLDQIDADNARKSQRGKWKKETGYPEQKNMGLSLEPLKTALNNWDETCKEMWDTYVTKHPETIKAECSESSSGTQTVENDPAKAKQAEFKQLCEEDSALAAIRDLVENDVKQIILTGAPGTGKTRAAGLAAYYMGVSLDEYHAKDPKHPYPLVQFHPSYDYTDFVEGLRPVQLKKGDTAPTFVKLDGSFKEFCKLVARENEKNTGDYIDDTQRRYFFLIDEINRADLSKVFGELMFCLEADKRGETVQTQYRNLPTYTVNEDEYAKSPDIFDKGFFIPKNVILLGTMNDIDRSVESMDFALRRRFVFHEIKVDEEMLKKAFMSDKFGPVFKCKEEGKLNAETAAGRVMDLNSVIESEGKKFGLNRQYDISQGQFAGIPDTDCLGKTLSFAWKYRIEPLLREYVRGEDDIEPFMEDCKNALLEGVLSSEKGTKQ